MDTIERIARAIADGLGCNFDHAFISKAEWNAARGEKGGRYRDINEPMQGDYMGASQAILPIITRREDQARAEGVAEGLGIAAADVKTWFPGDSIDKPLSVAGKSLYDSILAKRGLSNG